MEKQEAVQAIAQNTNVLKSQLNAIQDQLDGLRNLAVKLEKFPGSDLTVSHIAEVKSARDFWDDQKTKITKGFAECQRALTDLQRVCVKRVHARCDELSKRNTKSSHRANETSRKLILELACTTIGGLTNEAGV